MSVRYPKPAELFSPEEWRGLNQRSFWLGPALVLHAYGLMAIAVALLSMLPIWAAILLWPLAIIIFAGRQLGLAILMHEAAHNQLSSNPVVNDFLGNWLCGAPVAASMNLYRPYHLTHHKYTQQEKDPDLSLSAPFPISRASLKRKIWRDLTGQTWWKTRLSEWKMAAHPPKDWAGGVWQWRWEWLGRPFFVHLLLAGLLMLTGFWWAYFLLYLPAWMSVYMLIYRIRNIAEHACVETGGNDPYRTARTIKTSWWERLTLAPYWVNYHCEHHLFMYLPCWRLKKMHKLLQEKGLTQKMELAPSYSALLRSVIEI